jgi:hypothetical protein
MPSDKKFKISICKAYRQQTIDNWLFGYILGLQRGLPSVNVKRAVEQFASEFDLTEEEFPVDSACVKYYELLQAYRECRE